MHSLTALADPTRRRIIEMLTAGPLSSGDIARRFSVSAPAISQHLKTLREVRLVRVRPEKQKRFYELDPEGVMALSDWIARIRAFWPVKLDGLEDALKKEG